MRKHQLAPQVLTKFAYSVIGFALATSVLASRVRADEPSFEIAEKRATHVSLEPFSLDYAPGPADNPLKGLVPYQAHYPDRFPCSMEFNYLPLSALVKGPAQYDWTAFESMLDDIASRGHQTVVRIFLEYPGKTDVIPQFLVDDGLIIHRYLNTNTAPLPPAKIETPDYDDPKLQRVMTEFINEWGKRYDGDPRLAYITAGLLGTWGEWHTYPKTELWASKQVQREIYQAYTKSFCKTPVLLRYPAGAGDSLYADSTSYRFGYHDDSFAYATLPTGRPEDDWFFYQKMAHAGLTERWMTAPIGGEIRPEVWGCCFDDPPCTDSKQSFDDCRDQLHATWLMDTGMSQREKATPERYQRAVNAVRKMGYDIEIASVTSTDVKNDSINIRVTMRNRGIAPFYHDDWAARLHIVPQSGSSIQIETDWTPKMILPGQQKTFEQTITIAELSNGQYQILITVPNPMPNGKPIRFANKSSDLKSGLLPIATLWIKE